MTVVEIAPVAFDLHKKPNLLYGNSIQSRLMKIKLPELQIFQPLTNYHLFSTEDYNWQWQPNNRWWT
jgi:hypothetical protein